MNLFLGRRIEFRIVNEIFFLVILMLQILNAQDARVCANLKALKKKTKTSLLLLSKGRRRIDVIVIALINGNVNRI